MVFNTRQRIVDVKSCDMSIKQAVTLKSSEYAKKNEDICVTIEMP